MGCFTVKKKKQNQRPKRWPDLPKGTEPLILPYKKAGSGRHSSVLSAQDKRATDLAAIVPLLYPRHPDSQLLCLEPTAKSKKGSKAVELDSCPT